jgi:hypothetical protein
VQRADAGVAAPREHQLPRAAGADQLVVHDVGRHPDERQVPAALADDLVPGARGDEVGESFHCDGVTVTHQLGNAFGQVNQLCHAEISLFAVRTCVLSSHNR